MIPGIAWLFCNLVWVLELAYKVAACAGAVRWLCRRSEGGA